MYILPSFSLVSRLLEVQQVVPDEERGDINLLVHVPSLRLMWVPCHASCIHYGEHCEAQNLQHAHFGIAQARQFEISVSSTEGCCQASSLDVPNDQSENAAAQHPAAVPREADQPEPDAQHSPASPRCTAGNTYSSVRQCPA